jgi:hypothetical protein
MMKLNGLRLERSNVKIKIEDGLYIESDDLSFLVKEYSGKLDKNGNKVSRTLGYFNSVNQAVNFIIKRKLMRSDATTLKELLDELKRIEKWIEELVGI